VVDVYLYAGEVAPADLVLSDPTTARSSAGSIALAVGAAVVLGAGASIVASTGTAAGTGAATATGASSGGTQDALVLNANTDLLSSPVIPASMASYSMCGWVYFRAATGAESVPWYFSGGADDDSLFARDPAWTGGVSLLTFTDRSFNYTDIGTVALGGWYWFGYTRSGTTVQLYFAAEGATGLTNTPAGTAVAPSGVTSLKVLGENGTYWMDGRGSRFRLWDGVLSAAEMLAEFQGTNAVRTAGLVADWPLSNATTFGTDQSGNGNTLTNAGASYTVGVGPVLSGGGSATGVASAAGTGAAAGVGAISAASTATTAGVGTAAGTGLALAPAVASSSGVGAASATGLAIAPAVATSPGTGAAAATGAATSAAQASTAGVGAAASTGASLAATTATSSGTGAASGTALALVPAVAGAAGVGAATATGASSAASTGTSAGTGAASAVGTSGSAGTAVASAAGVGAAAATGTALAAAQAGAAGAGAAAGVGAALAPSQAASAGLGAASSTGASLAAATGTSAGVGAAAATGTSGSAGTAVASSAGVGTASATGAALVVATASAAGVGAASGTALALAPAVGTSSGTGAAAAVGSSAATGTAVGAAAVGTAAATGTSVAASTASASGVGAAAAGGTSLADGSGIATAAGTSWCFASGACLPVLPWQQPWARWSFEDASDAQVLDSTGRVAPLTVRSASGFPARIARGASRAWRFGGNATTVVADSGVYGEGALAAGDFVSFFGGGWTASFWVKSSGAGQTGSVFYFASHDLGAGLNGVNQVVVSLAPTTQLLSANQFRRTSLTTGLSSAASWAAAITDTAWHHVILRKRLPTDSPSDVPAFDAWRDGAALSPTTSPTNPNGRATDSGFAIPAIRASIGERFRGNTAATHDVGLNASLDSLTLWNRALSDTEVAEVYAAALLEELPYSYPGASFEAGLVALGAGATFVTLPASADSLNLGATATGDGPATAEVYRG
jgi:hypothetical protein